jgi:hypothetical protein
MDIWNVYCRGGYKEGGGGLANGIELGREGGSKGRRRKGFGVGVERVR